MLSSRWQKLLRDLWMTRGRMSMMVLAIAVSIFSIGTVLNSYVILNREISRNYLGTKPAAATLEMQSGVDDALIAAVRKQPGIADAEARTTVQAQFEVAPHQWQRLVLFVVKDFNAMRLSTFTSTSGAWPPPTGTMLVERDAPEVINASQGQTIIVKTPHGSPKPVPIVGLVHDPGLAPAWQEDSGYGYITPATLAQLGEGDQLNEIKILVNPQSAADRAAIEHTARNLAGWLEAQGHHVEEIQIPPPQMHPHQRQVNTLLTMLFVFGILAMILAAVLVATMINGLLTQQIRQIGVMKAIGARTSQIVTLYTALILLISVLAVVLALPLGIVAANAYASLVAQLLNITLYSTAIPGWVFLVQAGLGLLVPLLITSIPIARGSQITVREAISDYGVSQETFGRGRLDAWLGTLRGINRTLLLALRNTFRRRVRLLLTLALLAAAGGIFIGGWNVAASWSQTLDQGLAARHYDLEIRLNQPVARKDMLERIRAIPGVEQVEAWDFASTALAQPGRVDVVQTYPDGGHGSFTVFGTPDGTKLVQFPLLEGRWLQSGDTDSVVISQMVRAFLPNVKVGDVISLDIAGQVAAFHVVGMVQEIGAPISAYISETAFARMTNHPELMSSIRVVIAPGDQAHRGETMSAVQQTLEQHGASISLVITDSFRHAVVDGHFLFLVYILMAMAVLMGIVGMLGLTSAMSTSVVERAREFGIMKAIGSLPLTIVWGVVSEGSITGLLSGFVAIGLAVPLSLLIGAVVGNLSFFIPLPLVISWQGLLLWLGLVIVGASAASAVPAWNASQLTVRETLAYV
jgi:putative ABC transport system permease protein